MQTLHDVCLRHNLLPPVDDYPGLETRLDDAEKRGQEDGYLYLFADGLGGFIQNHRREGKGETFFWAGPGAKLNDDQKKELKKRREQARARLEQEYAAAAAQAMMIWQLAEPAAPDHPYLVRKGITSAAGQLRMLRTKPANAPRVLDYLVYPVLVCPITDVHDRPMTLEYIGADGDKRYHTRGEREAGLTWIFRGEWDKGPVYVVEGLSTGASVADIMNRPVAVAYDAGNLPKVAAALRSRFPMMIMIIAADDDVRLERAKLANKGLIKAQEAAVAGHALAVVVPDFTKLRERGDWSDFNDMAVMVGADAVRDRLDISAIPTEMTPPWLNDPLPEIRVHGFGEADLALTFARLRAGDLRYVAKWAKWMNYAGGVWEREETEFAYDLIGMLCREVINRRQEANAKGCPLRASRTRSGVERIVRADRRIAAVTDQWDTHDWLLNTPEGVIDLRTGVLQVHRPELYLTHRTTVSPAPKAEAPTWLRFISDVCCGDLDLAAYLQRLAGYCLTGATHEQVLVFFYGGGRNGKGTFLDTVKHILDGYYQAASADTFTESKSDKHKSELAVLMGARLVSASEVQQGKSWNDSRIKELTGQDTITANFMRCDPFTFVPKFKLIISSNNKPRFNNVDPAIRARLQLVPWLANFETSGTKDPHMREKLRAEAAGVLGWMVEGCLLWQQYGLQPPKSVRDATQSYLDAEDLEAQWLEECCVRDGRAQELLAPLFASWVAYAEARHGRAKRDRDLSDRLEREGLTKRKTMHGAMIEGIRLKSPAERGETTTTSSPANVVPLRPQSW